MMTNPECVLVDNGEVKFTGTLEGARIYLEGYADAVLDIAMDDYLEELRAAQVQAYADWLNGDDDDFDITLLEPDEVTLGPVVDATSVEPDDQDNSAAYADVVIGPWETWVDTANPAHEYVD